MEKKEKNPIGRDILGFDVITKAVKELLNQFPGLSEGEEVRFEELEEDGGIAFSNNSGALVYDQKKSITGIVRQRCQYPFYIVYRMASTKERQKLIVQEFLDVFGKWICREPNVYEHTGQIAQYPKLTGFREITTITRDNIYGLDPKENGVQDWVLPVTVEYNSKFRP